jgi:hypothetical protein
MDILFLLPALGLPFVMRKVDRGWGEPGGKTKAKLWALLAIAIGFLAFWRGEGPPQSAWLGAVIVLCVVIGRSMGFGKDAATINDKGDLRRAWIRAAIPVALAVGASAFVFRWDLAPTIAALVVFTIFAASVVEQAKDYGAYEAKVIAQGGQILSDDPFNARLEETRGFRSGVALAVWLAFVALWTSIT